MRRSRILLACAGVVLGGLLYVWLSRFDRVAAKAATTTVTAEDWDMLRQKPDDARVIAAAVIELHAASELPECQSVIRAGENAGTVLEKHPTTDDESLAIVAKMLATCKDQRSAKWTKRPPEDLVKMLRKDIASGASLPKDLLADALVALGPKINQELVDVLVSTVRADGSFGESLLAAGLPENSERLVGPKENVIRHPARSDERVAQGVRAWLGSMKEAGPTEDSARALVRAVSLAPPFSLDEAAAQAIAKAIDKVPAVEALCKAIVHHPDVAGTLKKHGSGPKIDECTAEAMKMKAVLDQLEATAAALTATGLEDEKGEPARQKRDAWEDEQAETFAKMGAPAKAAAREGLKASKHTVRRVSARTFMKLDRSAYIATIAQRMRAKSATPDDAKLALELMGKGSFEPVLVLGSYYIGDVDTSKRATARLKAEKPEVWVPALFADLTVNSANSPSVMKGFADALEQSVGTAPFCASILETSLTRAGRPEAVFWLTKMLALHALKVKGGVAYAPIIEKFTRDKTRYPIIKLRNDVFTGEILEESRTHKTISELAAEALGQTKAPPVASVQQAAQPLHEKAQP